MSRRLSEQKAAHRPKMNDFFLNYRRGNTPIFRQTIFAEKPFRTAAYHAPIYRDFIGGKQPAAFFTAFHKGIPLYIRTNSPKKIRHDRLGNARLK